MIKFDDVSKRYPSGHEALSHVSFALDDGELAFVTGHSGAGKSTLLKLIMRVALTSSGQLVINGQNLNKIAREQLPYYRRTIGLVFQDHQLLFDRSVYDNVALPLQIAGYDPREASRRVRAALDKVGLLRKETQNPLALSAGECLYGLRDRANTDAELLQMLGGFPLHPLAVEQSQQRPRESRASMFAPQKEVLGDRHRRR